MQKFESPLAERLPAQWAQCLSVGLTPHVALLTEVVAASRLQRNVYAMTAVVHYDLSISDKLYEGVIGLYWLWCTAWQSCEPVRGKHHACRSATSYVMTTVHYKSCISDTLHERGMTLVYSMEVL